MIQYSGGTLINRTFTPATRQAWVDNVTQALSDAGWTTISGTPGSGSDVKLETAAQNAGTKIRFRFLEPGSGACAQVTMKNVLETVTSTAANFALPTTGSGLWRIIANKFHFFAFASGNANTQASRGQIFGGTLWTPTFLNIAPTDPVGWLIGGPGTDGDTNAITSWRMRMGTTTGSPSPRWHSMFQANFMDSFGQISGDMCLCIWQAGNTTADAGYYWSNSTLPIYEPFVGWAQGNNPANVSRIKGQLYDAVVINGQWSGETTISLDNHTWMTITDGPVASIGRTAGLFLAVT